MVLNIPYLFWQSRHWIDNRFENKKTAVKQFDKRDDSRAEVGCLREECLLRGENSNATSFARESSGWTPVMSLYRATLGRRTPY